MTALLINFPFFITSADSFLNDTTLKTGLLNMVGWSLELHQKRSCVKKEVTILTGLK
jgi:hypothetical protein